MTSVENGTEAPAPAARIVIVMPAYNAANTLEETFNLIPEGIADQVIVVDDASLDATLTVASRLDVHTVPLPHNVGYGGNQKTCYLEALRSGADVVVMLHPDGQYDPELIPALVQPILDGDADMVLGSRLANGRAQAIAGGMPWWKYAANRFLTTVENAVLGVHFSELHTGYRAYSREFLESVPFLRNSNDFVFDTEIIVQSVGFRQRVVEVPVPTIYFPDASSINFRVSAVYGLKTLRTLVRFLLHRTGIHRAKFLQPVRRTASVKA
jgi:glycosyltransferase involved in cell wall biosynthesis